MKVLNKTTNQITKGGGKGEPTVPPKIDSYIPRKPN